METKKERIIWSNMDIELKDWQEFLEEEYPDVTDENEQYRIVYDMNDEYLNDERLNLDKKLDGAILVLADIGKWNGRVSGYRVISSGNIKDILYDDNVDYIKWYSDGYNIKATAMHHDGTNYYEYREIRDGVNIDTLLSRIYNGDFISRRSINYYTKSILPAVAEVYGW